MASADEIAQERREECRHSVLEFLALRQATAHHARTIRRRLNDGHEHDFSDDEVESALTFLATVAPSPFITAVRDSMGATPYYQATAAGVLAHERRG